MSKDLIKFRNNVIVNRERGVVLIMVLWTMSLLAIIAAGYSYAYRSEMTIQQNSESVIQARLTARSAIFLAYIQYFNSLTKNPRSQNTYRIEPVVFNDTKVNCKIVPISGRININVAKPELIEGLLTVLTTEIEDFSIDEAKSLSDAIIDWRDKNSEARLNGAEERDYFARGFNYGPRDLPYLSVSELNLVLGMRPEIYNKLSKSLTVYGRSSKVDPRWASTLTLRAIPNISQEQVEEYVFARAGEESTDEFPEGSDYDVGITSQSAAFLSISRSPVITIQCSVQVPTGGKITHEVVMEPRSSAKLPFRILEWREFPSEI